MAETGTETDGLAERFVAHLYSLARPDDRGPLAKLRRSVGKETPGAEALRLIAPFLPADGKRDRRCCCCELLAGLFALHPQGGGAGNLGDTFRRLGDNESTQKRFVALLDSRAEDLAPRLRQAVGLARSKEVPINWSRLLKDLFNWDLENRRVQYQWARAYWGSRGPEEDQEPAATAANEKEGE